MNSNVIAFAEIQRSHNRVTRHLPVDQRAEELAEMRRRADEVAADLHEKQLQHELKKIWGEVQP